ncbi:helix-turn-helix transcriptional regulator [Veronia pacifica]|uniref:HTH araC/xylS-type domain-containing protein n=1 Tax=Veronia pacifica TaxID=1080227 RepID=A0A1C3EMA5_9GAMM|nr:helix-turn-helix transcriptional regulator [Veronia pacifica]ODA34368.1 hypothetical protein A8L45_06490 [Veronia pacifica]
MLSPLKIISLKGSTVYGYLNEKRMIKARDMLIAGNVSVQQVAEAVGFKHSGYFCRLFKEKFTETPLEFMRKHGDS